MSVKLSICIPTYNRADFLGETLDSIISQANDDVEIVISDNASTDSTDELVRSYQAKFPRITYHKQQKNEGTDRNYLKIVELAQGDYCWLLGSDDVIMPGAIPYLLDNYINNKPIDFILITADVYDQTLTNVISRSADQLGITSDIYTDDMSWFFTHFFQESGFSVFIVNRNRWNSVDPSKYIGTELVYQAIVFEYLTPGSHVQIIAKPLLKYRAGNASWSVRTLQIMVDNFNRLLELLPERYEPLKPEAMKRLRKRIPVSIGLLTALRSENAYNLDLYNKYVARYFEKETVARCIAFIIAISPTNAIKLLRKAYFNIRGVYRSASCSCHD